MKNLRLKNITKITNKPKKKKKKKEPQRYNRACRFIGTCAVIKCHQLLSKVTSVIRRSLFDQLATDT